MKAITRCLWIAGLGVVVTMGAGIVQADEAKVSLPAAAPLQSGPGTFWNFLGIPQGSQAVRDARLNRFGNHPNRERVPPLKRIADPSNLESKNPAIAAAAKRIHWCANQAPAASGHACCAYDSRRASAISRGTSTPNSWGGAYWHEYRHSRQS